LRSIKLLKGVERVSILDVIDGYRANYECINMIKEMKMDQRVFKIEKWLINNEWKDYQKRSIKNLHILGKVRESTIRKEVVMLKTHW
jgi:hypothetical protein